MNRKAFLTSVLTLFTAPFIVKSKEKDITIPEVDIQWMNANPSLVEGRFIESQAMTAEEICRIYKVPVDSLRSQWIFTMNGKRRKNGKTGISINEDLVSLRRGSPDLL